MTEKAIKEYYGKLYIKDKEKVPNKVSLMHLSQNLYTWSLSFSYAFNIPSSGLLLTSQEDGLNYKINLSSMTLSTREKAFLKNGRQF